MVDRDQPPGDDSEEVTEGDEGRSLATVPPTEDDTKQYEVGYGRPPKHTRFKPGESGNRKGRKKGARSFKADCQEMLRTPVPITQEGRTRKVSTQAGALMRLREKALKGDVKALDRLLGLAALFNVDDVAHAGTEALLAEDQRILENARERRLEDDTPASTLCDAGGGT